MAGIEIRQRAAISIACALLIGACAAQPSVELAEIANTQEGTASPTPEDLLGPTETTPRTIVTPAPSTATTLNEAPDGLLAGGVDPATLVTSPEGDVLVQPTPDALQNRQLATVSRLDAPVGNDFEFSIQPLEGEALQRSTWNELCPVPTTRLQYVTVSFWGFDGLHHNGELIVAANEADNFVDVFRRLHAIRFPIEEMRIVTPSDVFARRTGDGNNTASYVCRHVTGGTSFSEHALGLAIDINPFQNPYQRGDEIIPALASSYLDRSVVRPGMIVPGDPAGDEVIAAFSEIGWAWGGDWNSLKDYQHFARNNR